MYMLPKIAVGVFTDKKELLRNLLLEENSVMSFEGESAKVDELRSWIYSGMNIMAVSPKYSMIIWDADKMSSDCQAVLLKPMEELGDRMGLILVAENENQLLPTILSRGVVEYVKNDSQVSAGSWDEIRKCWSSGPAACIAFVDGMEKEKAVMVMEEIILKLRDSFATEITDKRLSILDLAITCLSELKQTSVNYKLSMDNFLISSWRIIKTTG